MDFEQALQLMAALRDEKVEYVLVGALALTAHGIVRATRDIALFVQPSSENIFRLRKALRTVLPDDPSIDEISDQDLAGEYPIVRYR